MFGWIEGVFNRARGVVDAAISNLVHAAIRGLYGFLHSIFWNVIHGWEDFYNAVISYGTGELEFIRDVYNAFIRLFRHLIPGLNNRITIVNVTINKRITTVINDYNTKITNERKQRQASILALLRWVIAHVLNPLLKLINRLLAWVAHEGNTMWHFFTHLPAFAELLFWHLITALEHHAWDVGKYLGEFFLALIVHNIRRFALLVETIVDAIL
jgi:hypothetical protein